MANYAVNDFVTSVGTLEAVAAAMETQIETIDNTKTIRLFDVQALASGMFQGVIVTDV